MRIGIDARMWGPAAGGIGRYVEELVTELGRIPTAHEFVLFALPGQKEEVSHACPQARVIPAPVRWYGVAEQVRLPRLIDQAKLDLIHYPHWNVPLLARTPFVLTIHDLILLEEPHSARITTRHPLVSKIKRAAFHLVLHSALKRARKIIAVSNYTKTSILEHVPSVPESRIQVIYEGVTDLSLAKGGRLPGLLEGRKYFLYVGSAFPHKNLESLLHAFSFFHRLHPEITLVLAGHDDTFYARLKKEIDEIALPPESVLFLHDPSDAQLHALYQHASLYLFPSRIEGFGLPPLEAMKEGVPVAAAKSAALPEILGEAALYFSPQDIENMVEVMEKALTDREMRTELAQKGRARVAQFSWKTMAKETLAVYERART